MPFHSTARLVVADANRLRLNWAHQLAPGLAAQRQCVRPHPHSMPGLELMLRAAMLTLQVCTAQALVEELRTGELYQAPSGKEQRAKAARGPTTMEDLVGSPTSHRPM